MTTLSIITPWLDHAELIPDYERAVHGAQVILIDNGSRPDEAAQLRALAGRLRGVYVHNDANRGFAAANNQGLERADGETPGREGLWPAVEEFLARGAFRLKARYHNNNGLTVLEAVTAAGDAGARAARSPGAG